MGKKNIDVKKFIKQYNEIKQKYEGKIEDLIDKIIETAFNIVKDKYGADTKIKVCDFYNAAANVILGIIGELIDRFYTVQRVGLITLATGDLKNALEKVFKGEEVDA